MSYWEKYAPHVIDILRTFYLRSRIYRIKGNLEAEFFATDEPVGFLERHNFVPQKIKPNDVWHKKSFGAGWFHFTGKLPNDYKDKHYCLLIDIGGEGCLYSENGYPIKGITDKRQYISGLFAVKGKQELCLDEFYHNGDGNVDIWIEGGANNDGTIGAEEGAVQEAKFKHAWIVEKRDDILDLFYDYSNLAMCKAVGNLNPPEKRSLSNALNKAFFLGATLTKNNVAKAIGILSKAQDESKALDMNAYAVGHSHLDLAFLWPIRETRRKNIRTFANQLCNVKKFKDYVFGVSQPQLLEWLEEDSPLLFEEVKKAFASGRFVPLGGMWVEADMNLPSGEALIRQCYYGRKYWREKLGLETRICWLPDTFGYNGNLPQIIKKCGMDYFMTTKMSWNDHNKFPYHSFIWEGVDGTKVLAHLPPEETYSGEAMPTSTAFATDSYQKTSKSKNFLLTFGVGDGGGGPHEGHIEFLNRQKSIPGMTKVKLSGAKDFFEALEMEANLLPTYSGELYLEKHQGTYTTRAKSKLSNRKIEFALHNLEFILAVAWSKGYSYDNAKLDNIWKEVLLYQFHDILPGSSISRVYAECDVAYKRLFAEIEMMQNEALAYLAKGVQSMTAINLSPFAANEIFRLDGNVFAAEALSYSTARLVPYSPRGEFIARENYIESPLFKVAFDNGNITSIFDKASQKELCGEYMNRLNVYEDTPGKYDAWDIKWEYFNTKPTSLKWVSSELGSDKGICYIINNYAYGDSTLTQKVILEDGKPYVDFDTRVDWHENSKMLRAEFMPSVYSDAFTSDIQMGQIRRSTKSNNAILKAQFETCAHKYIDLCSNSYGISLISNSKYGWRVKDGLASLNLLRSSNRPAKAVDHGKHSFKYALYPHAQSLENSEILKVVYAYNNPIQIHNADVNINDFVATDTNNVVVETVKVAYDKSGIVVRLYEGLGKKTNCDLRVGFDYKKVYLCDCVEENLEETSIQGGLDFNPYEIKTLHFKTK